MTVGGPTITLPDGHKMPQVGLGTWQSNPGEVEKAVKVAVKDGYRLIDTAQGYENEEEIGNALQELYNEGVIKREDVFITTKIWSTHLNPERQEAIVKESLRKLRTDYLDLVLAHMPAAASEDMSKHENDISVEDIWKALEKHVEKGLVRSIGVSNFNEEQIERIAKIATVPIASSQVELHIYLPQHKMLEVCKKHGIVVTSYATLGSPGRVNFRLKSGAKLVWAEAPSALDNPLVIELAKKYNKTPAQILIRWAMDLGVAVIPKSVNGDRIKQNFELFDFHLEQDEVEKLSHREHHQRLFLQDFMEGHKEDAFADERGKQ
ncbi:unnamed protein product, partial [Mesorhabditis belari]|uniref:NADP-dependent oxidoreductase domain-containing protein n=1 Tax=Mesorhabditis belari TaxID=2138241 RepID=A0AAF3FHB8_9BILA